MKNLVLTKKTSAIFLAIVLVAGTIATFIPSFMVGTAQAQPYYGMDRDRESDRKSVSVSSLKCNNINVNVNGLELDVFPPFLGGGEGLAAEAQNANTDASSFAGNGPNGESEINDFRFICINNNNNTVVEVDDGVTPPTPAEEECVLCFTNVLFLTGPVEITDEFIMQYESIFDTDIDLVAGEELTLLELCGLFEEFSEVMTQQRFVELLEALNIVIPLDIEPFINCLIDAGIVREF